jgi:hypothetical protein
MQPERTFFPYRPRVLRVGLFAAAAASLGLSALALSDARGGGGVMAYARVVLLLGFGLAFAAGLHLTRARAGWGVWVEPLRLVVSRPLHAVPWVVGWVEVSHAVRRGGGWNRRLVLHGERGRLSISQNLFCSAADFERLCDEVEARLGPSPK